MVLRKSLSCRLNRPNSSLDGPTLAGLPEVSPLDSQSHGDLVAILRNLFLTVELSTAGQSRTAGLFPKTC
jgi:hypothetical protein